MRGPNHTQQALTVSLSGRGVLIVVGAIAIACVLAVVSLLLGRPSSHSALLNVPSTKHSESRAPAIAAESERSGRSSAEIAEPGEVFVAPPEAQLASHPNRFSGRFVLGDGSIPPEMSFQLELKEKLASATEDCSPLVRVRTDRPGAFQVDGLCTGNYAITPGIPGLLPQQSVYRVPAEGVSIVLAGSLLHVRVLARSGAPAPASKIGVMFVQPAFDDRPERISSVELRANEGGEAWFGLPEPGVCTITATLGRERSLPTELQLDGTSRTVDVPLVLDVPASLRVELRSCDPPHAIVEDFCIELLDPASGAQVTRLSAEQAREPVFPGLQSGSFRVRAVDRIAGLPIFYLPMDASESIPIELAEGKETRLSLCVRLGGRLSVLVGDGTAEPKYLESVIVLVDPPLLAPVPDELSDKSSSKSARPVRRGRNRTPLVAAEEKVSQLSFRPLPGDPTLAASWRNDIAVDDMLTLDEERLTHEVLPPGTYTVTARAEGYAPASESVHVVAGETTRVTIRMQKQ